MTTTADLSLLHEYIGMHPDENPRLHRMVMQRAILLESIATADAESLTARARLTGTSPYANGAWAGAALIEVAAQAAAAHGACAARARGGPARAPQGFLVGVKNLHLESAVPLDVPLRVDVRRVGGAGPLALFTAEVWREESLLMRGELSVWSAENRR